MNAFGKNYLCEKELLMNAIHRQTMTIQSDFPP